MVGSTAWSSHLRRAIGIALVLMVAGPATGAQALDPPEILYREGVSENEATGPWLPLDGAHISSLGFILGSRGQATSPGDNRVYRRLSALSVPDGHPDQGPPFEPGALCNSTSAAVGEAFVLAIGRFEGPGSYAIRLEANVPSAGATIRECSGGPASTATFTIDPVVTLDLLARAPVLLAGNPFKELVRIPSLPVGGAGETQCARNGVVQADGSIGGAQRTKLLGATVMVRNIARTGRWTCVARARVAVGPTADGDHYTRWSAPVSFDTVSAFSTRLSLPDRFRPRFTLTYGAMPPGSEGGLVTLRIAPGANCPHVPTKTLRARVGPKRRVRFTFTLAEKDKANLDLGRRGVDSYGWRFTFAFGGTKLVLPAHESSAAAVLPHRFPYGDRLVFGQPVARCIRTS